jgi:PAS domain S-box-containing protein
MSFTAMPEQSAKQLHYLFEEASLGIAVEDLDGKVLRANPALCSMLGFEEKELCALSCSDFAEPEDSQEDWALFQKLRAGLIDRYSIEKRYVRKDGIRIWGWLSVSLLKPADGGAPLVFAFVEDITERKRAEEALSLVSGKLIEAQEKERTRIAREIHDDISQRLALLVVELQQTEDAPPDSAAEMSSRIGEFRQEAFDILKDIQALSHQLHSSKLEYLGMVAAMGAFCREFGEQQNMEIEFRSHGLKNPPPPAISLSLFRVLQEALHNAVKHSGVRHFEVELWEDSDEIHLAVNDLGAGFDIHAAKQSPGLGLVSMQERLRLVDGELSVESQPKRGTTIHARVPLDSENASKRAPN